MAPRRSESYCLARLYIELDSFDDFVRELHALRCERIGEVIEALVADDAFIPNRARGGDALRRAPLPMRLLLHHAAAIGGAEPTTRLGGESRSRQPVCKHVASFLRAARTFHFDV